MNKYKDVVKKSANLFNIKEKIQTTNRKKMVFILIILLIIIAGAVYLILDFKKDRAKLTSLDKSKIGFTINKTSCEKNIAELEKMNSSSFIADDSAKLLNYRGNCYYEVGQYEKALKEFEAMKLACQKANDKKCLEIAEGQIEIARYAVDHPVPAQRPEFKDEATPAFRQELREQEMQEQ